MGYSHFIVCTLELHVSVSIFIYNHIIIINSNGPLWNICFTSFEYDGQYTILCNVSYKTAFLILCIVIIKREQQPKGQDNN